jgi:hypothetical protein
MVLEAALKCPVALQAAVEALGWTWLGHGIHTQYVRKTEGHGIAIPGFYYDVVVDAEGAPHFDEDDLENASKRKMVDDLYKGYHVHVAALDAVERNGVLTQTILDDGSIEIDVHVGGGATELGKEPPTLGGTSAPTL